MHIRQEDRKFKYFIGTILGVFALVFCFIGANAVYGLIENNIANNVLTNGIDSDSENFLYADGQKALTSTTSDGLSITDNTYIYCKANGNMSVAGSIDLENTNSDKSLYLTNISLTSDYSGSDYGTYTLTNTNFSATGTLNSCECDIDYELTAGSKISVSVSYTDDTIAQDELNELLTATKSGSKFANVKVAYDLSQVYAVYNSGTLTFYYDESRASRTGTIYDVPKASASVSDVPWYSNASSITSVVFDSSFASCTRFSSCAYWFYGCDNSSFTSIDLANLNNSKVTNTTSMFNGCSSLATIYCTSDWSSSTTLTSSTNMFSGCSVLTGSNGTGLQTDVSKTYGRPDVPGQVGYFTVSFAVMDVGDATIDAVPSGWTSFVENSTTKYWKKCYGTGASTDVATVITTFSVTYTFQEQTYTTPIGGYEPSSGTITTRQDIKAVWTTLNYIVSIYGIDQDGTNTVTFGPATGADNSCLTQDSCGSEHCIHNESWQTIIDNINNGHSDYYDNCLVNNCVKAVPINLNSDLGTNPTDSTNCSCLYNTITSTQRVWNTTYSTSDCESANWATSRIRATLNGYNNSWGSFTPSSYAGSDYCNNTNSLFTCLPSVLQNNIKTKSYKVPTSWSTSDYSISASTTVTDKLWLPTNQELSGGWTGSNYLYFYYSDSSYGITEYTKMANGGALVTASSNNILKAYNESGSANYWWLRSPNRYYPYSAGIVYTSGSVRYSSYVNYPNYALAPCFIL